ncbi:unnamed protein product [Brugia timori]|uniref:Secreted protein n=1 Tax=Brugia timori TaxID=42155 RepID=A0A0R3Q619_9BILA|nr:unnamed protein product [Brugia timori]
MTHQQLSFAFICCICKFAHLKTASNGKQTTSEEYETPILLPRKRQLSRKKIAPSVECFLVTMLFVIAVQVYNSFHLEKLE